MKTMYKYKNSVSLWAHITGHQENIVSGGQQESITNIFHFIVKKSQNQNPSFQSGMPK